MAENMASKSQRHVSPQTALTEHEIWNAIDSACLRAGTMSDGFSSIRGWTWDRWNSEPEQQLSLLYGFVGKRAAIGNTSYRIVTVTFFFAYSTWDGRILYIDNVMDSDTETSVTLFVYALLADIATQLHCHRYDPRLYRSYYPYSYFITDVPLLSVTFLQAQLATQSGRHDCVSWSCPTRNHAWMVDIALG
jgi:hypothetical protein